MKKVSFEPLYGTDLTRLILGTLPGDRSLLVQQYYGHPQNRFWKILSTLFQEPIHTYTEKENLIRKHHLGLWDVCAQALRKGSLDTAILEEIPNPLDTFIQAHPELKTIFFNGQKAQKLYDKYFPRYKHIQYICLPSSSPANANYNFEKLLQDWIKIK